MLNFGLSLLWKNVEGDCQITGYEVTTFFSGEKASEYLFLRVLATPTSAPRIPMATGFNLFGASWHVQSFARALLPGGNLYV